MSEFSTGTEQKKIDLICSRWLDLKSKRSSYLNQWRSVSRYVSPFSGRFDITDKNNVRDTRFILDAEASHDLNILASGLMSGASSPARPWFKVEPNDQALNNDYSVIEFCDAVNKILLKVFSASNTYNTLHSMYRELALFGIACDLVYDSDEHGIQHHLLSAGEYCVDVDNNGEIDTLYRNFTLTTAQVVKEFGYDNTPKEIQDTYNRGDLGSYWEFLHAIEPRIDRDPKSKSNSNKAWASYYCSLSTRPAIIRESGYDYFPALVPRWDVLGTDAYGTSPSINCLPDIKQLQQETLRKAEIIDHLSKPPLQVPNSARQSPISLATGAINYTQSTSPEQMIRPITQGIGDVNSLTADIAAIKDSIRRSYFVDLFQMVGSTAGDRRTTVEIYALQHEQMLSLGPVVERSQNELLGRLVNLTFRKLGERGLLPELPPALENKPLTVEFTSVLAQSQKSVDINSVDRLVSAISAAAQIAPEVLDRIDPDGYVDEYRDRLGVAPKILRSREDAQKIREQRAQAQQQQQQLQEQNIQAQTQSTMAQAQKNGADASLAMQQLDDVGGGSLL